MAESVLYYVFFSFAALVGMAILFVGIRGKKSLVFFCVLDLALLIYSIYDFQDTIRFKSRALAASGEIVSFYGGGSSETISNSRMGSHSRTVAAPLIAVVEFLPTGAAKTVVGNIPWAGESKAHQTVNILYDREDPSRIRLAAFWELYEDSILGFTSVLAFTCLIFFISKKRSGMSDRGVPPTH